MEHYALTNPQRDRQFFGFDWQFALTDSRDFPAGGAKWRPVQLPHDWSMDYSVEENAPSAGSGGYARTGIGWYKKTFTLAAPADGRIALHFEGAYMNCDAWLNGKPIGGHIYGYTPFELELGDACLNGENELLVRVDNSQQPNSRWYTGSGITRDVYLCRTGLLHIPTVYITTPKIGTNTATVDVRTDVKGAAGSEAVRLVTEIYDPAGTLCANAACAVPAKADSMLYQRMSVQNPSRWDLDTPVCYTVVSSLYRGKALCDRCETRFGIRTIDFSTETGFLLNGRKVIFQGVCLHQDGGCVGAAVPPEVWKRRLERFKEMGVNALRCAHNPPDVALLDLADDMGFVVMDEAFDEWHTMKAKVLGSNTHESRGYSEWFESRWREDVTAMVLRDRNHPSIVMWSIGNEVIEQVIEDGWTYARELAGLCHSLDPTRPVTQACDNVKAEPVPAYTEFLNELDIVGVNYTDRWRERTETFYDEEKHEYPDWLLFGTEDMGVGGIRGKYSLKPEGKFWGAMLYYTVMLKAEKLWKYTRTRPFVLGNFMWTGIDYRGECFWPDKGASCGVMDTCAFPKDGFYFYQSQWRKDQTVLHLAPHLNLSLPEGTIYPLVCYTNCFSAELFVGGRSYGQKAYEFPSQGMTQRFGHFDRPVCRVTTNDLHLCWDIPYAQAEIVAVGYDETGAEIARTTLTPAGKPAAMDVRLDCDTLPADGRSVAQFEITLRDQAGLPVPDADVQVEVQVEGGTLLAMDNGDPACHALPAAPSRQTFHGLAYGLIRAPRRAGDIRVTFRAPSLPAVTRILKAE